ncbi:hypothetical protein D9619_001255 [Psilocybe cf. subviscida]|uniref:L domain-like protein n=1 Tax=Psilocybe cf. subviscida TaxID=2480587 RepID=A0A8H5BFR6_9AGAR|nr:hypothetical protein D9619_001255 [Psilocybe cf. subviscida]
MEPPNPHGFPALPLFVLDTTSFVSTMSRIPQPSSSKSGLKPPTTPVKSRMPVPKSPMRAGGSTPRPVATSKPKATATPAAVPENSNETPALSIKEAIALKRAEAKKAMMKSGGGGGGGGFDSFGSMEDALPSDIGKKVEEEDLLGRLPLRDAIEQARSTGSLNLAARSLPCLPSALFEIHLGLTSDPLKSVPNEPALPPSDSKPSRRGGDKPAWFEAQDLTILKAWKNDIEEIQHEISLFGSLKTVDLHENKITILPHTFTDLTSLTVLDLSHNALTSLPEKLFSLPELTNLNISHNQLISLPFNAPFSGNSGRAKAQQSSGGFFTPVVTHSTTPLPRLITFDASWNKITASAIDTEIPVALTKIDLSGNPLGPSQRLLHNFASLKRINEVKLHKCQIGDDSLSDDLSFELLRLLDFSETQVTKDAVERALKCTNRELNFDFSTQEAPEGVLRVLVGKQIIKEPWELELERRTNMRKAAAAAPIDDWFEETPTKKPTTDHVTAKPSSATTSKAPPKPKEVVKEAWEIEAEQGLLTEGGRRRARAAAAAAAEEAGSARSGSMSPSHLSGGASTSGLSNPQYFTHTTQTLKLPASMPPTNKAGHGRAFSMAATPTSASDLTVPTPTLPLSVLVEQPFTQTLRVLTLVNRRADRSFALPSMPGGPHGFLPRLEELDFEGCNLGDLVSVYTASDGTSTPARNNEPILPTLAKLFPSLRTLNLSYNAITSAALTPETLTALIVPSPEANRPGLRHLRLRGNRISDLDGFLGITNLLTAGGAAPALRLEELDFRDNEIGKIPPELGLLSLDVLLVEGNVFRVPQRRVWEREGTKGLLTWLRGRIE